MRAKIIAKLMIIALVIFFSVSIVFQSLSASDRKSPAETYGVGIMLAKEPGGFVVRQVIPGSSAALSGAITNGDLIVAVGQSNEPPVFVEKLDSVLDVVGLIRGPNGSLVRLTMIPRATNITQERVVNLIRGDLKGLPFGGLWLRLTNGASAPSQELLRLPDKVPISLKREFGRFIVLDFWATWCSPCLRLMPQTQKEVQRFQGRSNILWMTVSLDDNPDLASKKVRASNWTNTVNCWGGPSAARSFGINGVPEMLVIGPTGTIIYQGFPMFGEALHRLIE
jgi:thiol-disulfide isomerase/thioredoxin